MLHYKVTQDGETISEYDSDGILALVNDKETVHTEILFDGVSGDDLMCLILALDKMKERLFDRHKELRLMYELHNLIKANKPDNNDEKE